MLDKTSGAFRGVPMASVRQARSLLIEHAETVAKHGLVQATNQNDFLAFVQGSLGRKTDESKPRRVEPVHPGNRSKKRLNESV